MTNKQLTDAAVRKYAAGPHRRRIRDAGARSLFLIVEPSGHKSFQMRFRTTGGRISKITLGPYDASGRELQGELVIGMPLTLAAARSLAAEVHRQRALGHDVIANHKAAKHRQRAEIESRDANTFAAAVRAYIREHAQTRTRNWHWTARLLGLNYGDDDDQPTATKGGLIERWGDRPVASIDAHDIWSVIDEARRVGVPGLAVRNTGLSEPRARSLYVALSSLFSWLARHRRVTVNPCTGTPRPANAQARERVLSNAEIVWFWRATDMVGEPFGALFKLLLLTGARLNEVAGMRRDELAKDLATWSLAGQRTKNKRPHIVPLPPLAREIIAGVQSMSDALVFSTTGTVAVSGWSRVKDRLDKAMLAIARKEKPGAVIPHWRLHDLRRSAVTGMVELGVQPHVVEQIVNHVSGTRASVAGTYNRSQMLPERKVGLERWADHVEGLVKGRPAKIVPMRRSKAK